LWVRAVEDYAVSRLEAGHKIPGYELKPSRAKRVWNSAEAAAEQAKKDLDLSLYREEIVTPAQAEKLFKAAKVSKETIENFFNDNVALVSASVKLSQVDSNNDFDFLDADESESLN